PLTRPWYLGLANIRGLMANVVDFAAFLGAEPTVRTPNCRLVLVADRFQSYSGLLISRMMGLRNVQTLAARETSDATERKPWVAAAAPKAAPARRPMPRPAASAKVQPGPATVSDGPKRSIMLLGGMRVGRQYTVLGVLFAAVFLAAAVMVVLDNRAATYGTVYV